MFQKTPKILLSHILPITLMFILSQTIHSSLFSPTVNFTVLHHIHPAINTPSYPLSLSTHTQHPQPRKTPHPLSYSALPATRIVSLRLQSTLDQPDPYSSHTNSGDCDFPSCRELPIWSPILGFSKLSTLNFEIPSNQAPKLRFQ